jgi:hypothetical protein
MWTYLFLFVSIAKTLPCVIVTVTRLKNPVKIYVAHRFNFVQNKLYHRERILETSTLSCNEEEEEITKPPKR